jgi:hypothetical protein
LLPTVAGTKGGYQIPSDSALPISALERPLTPLPQHFSTARPQLGTYHASKSQTLQSDKHTQAMPLRGEEKPKASDELNVIPFIASHTFCFCISNSNVRFDEDNVQERDLVGLKAKTGKCIKDHMKGLQSAGGIAGYWYLLGAVAIPCL